MLRYFAKRILLLFPMLLAVLLAVFLLLSVTNPDGFGTFPEQMPDYETAFVFLDEELNNYDVPPWAMKLILRKE